MDNIAAVAFSFAIAGFAAAIAQPASAQSAAAAASSAQSATPASQPRIVPAATEDGDMTLEGFEGIACAPLYSQEIVPVGPVFGDAEKDTVARTVVGTDCR